MPDYGHYAAMLGVRRLGRRSNWDSCPWILTDLNSLLECVLDYGRAGLVLRVLHRLYSGSPSQ